MSKVNGKVSQAQMRATAKYEKANYDKIMLRLPKGMKEEIMKTGESLNGFFVRLGKAELEAIANRKD